MSCNKKYIIITPRISNMGGAQMYIRNKYLYMQSQGWDVDIITSHDGKIYIADLKHFRCIIPELGHYIYLFSKSTQNKIITNIIKTTIKKKYDEIIIESTCMGESTWAEVIAQRIGAKHLLFDLQEQHAISSKVIQDFLIFKYNRRKLVGIAPTSLYNLFLPFAPINIDKSYRLPAYCNNVVEDTECPLLKEINTTNYDYVVGCLSRLDKPFIMPALNDFIIYLNKHTDKKYLFLMIGGAPEGSSYEQKIRDLFKNISNVDIIITGYMFPIPSKLLDICNAFFTSAGSVWVCMRSGIPTISYDANDFCPIGIIGRTTQNALMRADNEPEQDFSQLMDDILENIKYGKEPQIRQINKPDFSSHDEFLSLMSPKKEYFCFDNVQLEKKEKLLSIMLKLFGVTYFAKIRKIKQRMIKD